MYFLMGKQNKAVIFNEILSNCNKMPGIVSIPMEQHHKQERMISNNKIFYRYEIITHKCSMENRKTIEILLIFALI